MAKPKSTAPRARKATTADIIRLGQATADLKANTPPKQWAQIVKNAHASGFTLAGALSGNPDPLKERTQSYLKSQAQSTVDTAYKPAYADNDAQQSRLKAWDAKRTIDNHAYEEWVQNQLANLKSQGDAADQQLRDAAHGATQQTQAAWTASPSAPAPDGSGQSKALDLAPWASQATAAAAAGEQHAKDITSIFANTRPIMQAGALASQAALTAAASGEMTRAMKGVIDDRAKLTIAKAGDYVKNLTDLQGKEVSKASSNRDYQTVVQQLNQAGAKIEQAGAIADAKLHASAEQNTIRNAQAEKRLGLSPNAPNAINKYNYTNAAWKQMTPEQRNKAVAKFKKAAAEGTGKKGKDGYLPPASQNVASRKIDKAVVAVKNLKGHYTEAEVRNILLNGRPAITGKNSAGETVRVPAIPAIDKAWLNVAMDIAYRTGISAANINALHKRGIKVNALGYALLPAGAKNTRPTVSLNDGSGGFPSLAPTTAAVG